MLLCRRRFGGTLFASPDLGPLPPRVPPPEVARDAPLMPRSVDADTRQLRKLTAQLQRAKASALPYAEREFVNSQAFASQRLWRQGLPGKMKLRSKYTESSVQVEKAKLRGHASVGSTASYMPAQELGDTQAKRGKHGVPIPAAAPGKRKSRGRVSKSKQLASIAIRSTQRKQLGSTGRGIRRQALLRIAATGGGFVFMDLGRSQGIYHVRAGKTRLLVRKVWDLTKQTVTIPENPTMRPAVELAMRSNNELWRKAITFQLKRHKLFGY